MAEETVTPSLVEQPQVAAGPDWSLLNDLSNNQEVKIESPKVETPAQIADKDIAASEPKQEEIKVDEPAKPVEATPAAPKVETPTEVINPDFEIKAADIADVPTTYEDGDWRGVAKELGAEITENSFDAFKANFVPKSELESIKTMTKESLLSEYSPETIAAIKLMELGVPQEMILTPTLQIDNMLAQADSLLKLSDAELYRTILENSGSDWTPELIDAHITDLAAEGKLATKAQVERLTLKSDQKALLADRENVLKTRESIIQQHTSDKQRIAEQKREQESTLFLKALDDKLDFMGVPVPKEVKDAVALKFRGGLYDSELTVAQNKVDLILFKELGPKFAKLVKDSAFAKGKESEIKKAANIPPTQSAASPSQRSVNTEPQDTDTNQFHIIKEAFGGK